MSRGSEAGVPEVRAGGGLRARPLRANRFAPCLATALFVWGGHAQAQPKQCIGQHTAAQEARRDAKLLEAKELATACTRDQECPAEVARECAALLDQIKLDMPSLVFAALDEHGQDTTEVKVYVDGKLVLEQLDIKAVEFDPGRYELRFEAPNGKLKEQTVIVREGERNRRIVADFRAPVTPVPAGPPPPPRPRPPQKTRIPLGSIVLASVGAAALGSFGYFAWDGNRKERGMTDPGGCAPVAGGPGCFQEDVDAMRRSYLFADISLGVAVLALGSATIVFFASNSGGDDSAKLAPRIGLGPLPGGGRVSAWTQF